MSSHSRGAKRPGDEGKSSPRKIEGAGNAGCALHPRSRVQDCAKNAHTSIQVQRKHSGIPRAMVLRLMASSPRRRIRLVTVIDGLAVLPDPVGPIKTSADLTPATGARTTRFCRTHQHRSSCALVIAHERLALRSPFRADAAASTASSPAFRDDRDTPLLSGKDGQGCIADLPDALSGVLPVGLICRTARHDGKERVRQSAGRS